MNEITAVGVRDINTISAEIRLIKANVQKVALEGAIEIGRRLTEAKEMLPHGEWGDWLREEFEYSQPTASRLMTLFREYGSAQGSLFGAESKYSTLNSLDVSKALLLVAIPENERESFAAENKIEDLSTRELDRLIKEKQEAEERAARAEKELESAEDEKREAVALAVSEYESTVDDIQKLLHEAESASKAAEGKVKTAEKDKAAADKARKAAEKSVKELEKQLAAAREDAAGARRDLKELRDNPEIPEEVMEKLRSQFGAAAAEAEARAAELEKQLAMASPELTEFQIHMQNAQREFSAMMEIIGRTEGELAEKLSRAARAVAARFSAEVEDVNV